MMGTSFCWAADDVRRHVAVTGTATVEVVPDEMNWTLNVTTRGQDVANVAGTHDEKVAGVITFLKDHGIAEKKIRTSRISLSENWTYQNRNRVMDGYIGSTTMTFESDELEKYRELWIGLANLKDVSVAGVGFDTSERIRHQNQQRLRAVGAAREKAEALAEALDVRLGPPISLTEDAAASEGYPRPLMASNRVAFEGAARGPGDSSMSPGTITIRTRVQATFELITD